MSEQSQTPDQPRSAKLPETGMSQEEIFGYFKELKSGDLDWRDGRIMGYIYAPDEHVLDLARAAYMHFLIENPLDPTVFPSLLKLENDIVGIALDHLNAPETAAGNFTSGGTESILLAVKAARELARRERGIETPAMIMPVTAHAAFHKAAEYFDVEKIMVDVDPDSFRATREAFEEALTPETILLVASSPSYAHGVIDHIEDIGALAEENDLLLHIDACVGGWLLPYFERLGKDVPPFDFRVPGVTSISMDLHKYGYVPKGASLVLYRDKAIREHQIFSCSTWTGYTVINPTVQSSRTGGPLGAAWAVLHRLGDDGYLDIARHMKDATDKLVAAIDEMPDLDVMVDPDFCMFAITSDTLDIFQLVDEMKVRDWYVQPQLHCRGHRANIHLSVNLAIAHQIDNFLERLDEAVEATRSAEPVELPPGMAGQLEAMLGSELSPEVFSQMLGAVGVENFELPERTAVINHLLDNLPENVSQDLLTRFFNELLSPNRD